MLAESLAAKPAPSFDDPLGMLTACHRRIERQLATLARLQRHLPENGCDADARAAARAILKYFDSAAPNHHADEERSVFPRIATSDHFARALVADLKRDHTMLVEGWRKLRPLLAAIVAGHRSNLSAKQVNDLTVAYQSHIDREERDLLPLAAQMLDAVTIAEIGREMAQRRGVDPATSSGSSRAGL